jgi:hypothetical protein
MKRIIADVEDELHQELKIEVAKENITIKDKVIELVNKYLAGKK